MRKFKLIKEYPGSPEVGYIVYERHCGMYRNAETGNRYGSQHIENQPEYWEEVVEKDYEILSWTAKDCNSIAIKGSELPHTPCSLPADYWRIHSVKRLSDGEIFTIGDRAKTITSKGKHTVTQLSIRQKCTGRDGKGGYTYDGIDRIWIDWEDDCGGNWLESTEKVIEKDFEITEIQLQDKTILTFEGQKCIKRSDPLSSGATLGLDKCLADSKVTVHSVKRISDGEIFTVGDKFKANIGGSEVIRTVESIKVDGNILTIYQEYGWLTNEIEDGGIFHEITKCVEPIFVTEDGVKIFEGDIYYYVDTDLSISMVKASYGNGQYTERKYFSTFELAEDYVIKNAKVLSMVDFWQFTSSAGSNFVKNKQLKRLVKQRLIEK